MNSSLEISIRDHKRLLGAEMNEKRVESPKCGVSCAIAVDIIQCQTLVVGLELIDLVSGNDKNRS